MIQITSPVAASPKWLRISGGRIFVPGSRPCCIPPRESQIAKSTNPPPAVTTHAISAAHSIDSASFRPVPSVPARRPVKRDGIRTTRASGLVVGVPREASAPQARAALAAPAVCYGCAAVAAEGSRREADTGRRLAALVLRAVDQREGALDDGRVESVLG